MNKSDFSDKIELFLKRTNISPTVLGIKAKGDPNFVFRIRKGLESRESTQEKVLSWMKQYEKEHGLSHEGEE